MDPLANLEARVETFLGSMGVADAYRPGGVSVVAGEGCATLVTCFAQDGATWCRIAAVPLTDVEPSLALLTHLLEVNHDVLQGAFQLFADGTLAFSATLHGHNLDADAFSRTLTYVTWVATNQAPQIQAMAGGRPWAEAPEGSLP